MENAVVYARYSSHSQTDQSIEGQINAAQKYAADHNYNIIHYYCDKAKTGTNDNREEFQKMLADSSRGAFSVVIVWKVDRFGRNREEIAFNKYKLKKNKARVEYVAENVSSGPEGVILESVLEGMAEYYSLQLSQNIRRGQLETAKKFRLVNGHYPLGYVKNALGDYSVEPKEAKIVTEIFTKVANGYSLADVTKWLNGMGYKTKTGRQFTKSSLPRILDNELYIGTYKFKDLVYAEDVIPAIISKDLWKKAHERLSIPHRKPVDTWAQNNYLLTGKIFCGECGASMMGASGTSKSGAKYNYYICSKRHGSKECTSRTCRKELLEAKVIETVKDFMSNENIIEQIVSETWQYYLDNLPKTNTEKIQELEKEIENIDRKVANLIKAVGDGMDYTLIKEELNSLNTFRKDNLSMIEGLKSESMPSRILTKESIELFLRKFLMGDITNENCQEKILNTFVNSVVVNEKEITIAVNYTDNGNPYTIKGVRNDTRKWSYANDLRTLQYSIDDVAIWIKVPFK